MWELATRNDLDDRERSARERAAMPRVDRDGPSRGGLRQRLAELLGPSPERPLTPSSELTIRAADERDASTLARLAQLTERRVPDGPFLVAEDGADVIAALPLGGGAPLTDIRRGTADAVQLLELRSRQLRQAA